jgi:hypothetical protein
MEVRAKKGGTVEWLIKPFHPFNLLSASTFGVKRLFCMHKKLKILNLGKILRRKAKEVFTK